MIHIFFFLLEKKNTCSVCLGHLEEDNEVKTLLCKHQFHTKCILPWLEKVSEVGFFWGGVLNFGIRYN